MSATARSRALRSSDCTKGSSEVTTARTVFLPLAIAGIAPRCEEYMPASRDGTPLCSHHCSPPGVVCDSFRDMRDGGLVGPRRHGHEGGVEAEPWCRIGVLVADGIGLGEGGAAAVLGAGGGDFKESVHHVR